MLFMQSAYAQNSNSIEEIGTLVIKIKNLKEDLTDLQSQLEKIIQRNGTSQKCNCENLQEKIEELKSQLKKMEEIANATHIECNCVETPIKPELTPKGPNLVTIAMSVIAPSIALAIFGWYKSKPQKT